MIPILYESGETEFTNNGLGRLRDCTECVVTEERNGVYELDFSYPIDGFHYEDIQLGRIIAVEHDDTDDVQPFDIISYSKPINGIVSFHAVHVSYRLCKVTTSGTNIDNLVSALDMLRNAVPENDFQYYSDRPQTGYMASADGVPRSVRQFLGGIEGSILDTYGGEYEFDKFDVHLWDARGEVRDLTIRYGVNLTDYNEEVDYSDTYTNCIPYWTGDDGTGKTIVVQGSIVGTGRTAYNGRYECVPLDLTDKFENQPTTAQLESAASSYMTNNQVYLPAQNIKVDFIRLQDSTEFQQFAPLMECKLCDMIRVEFPKYGMSGSFKIVKTTYDVLRERFTEMELGTLSVTLADALGITSDSNLSNPSVKYPIKVMQTDGTGASMQEGSQFSLTAQSISGYTFICWLYAGLSGWSGAVAIGTPMSQTSAMFVVHLTGTSAAHTVTPFGIALYMRDDLV